jgi:hypothetical protein
MATTPSAGRFATLNRSLAITFRPVLGGLRKTKHLATAFSDQTKHCQPLA